MQDHIITEELCKRPWMSVTRGENLYIEDTVNIEC